MIEQESVKGFPEVVVGTNVSDCISHVIQVDVTSLPKNIFEFEEDFKIFGQSIQFLLVYSGHRLIQNELYLVPMKFVCSHEKVFRPTNFVPCNFQIFISTLS